MAKVTIIIQDRESDGAVEVISIYNPPLPAEEKKRTDAQNAAEWLLEDLQTGETFCDMLSRLSGAVQP